METEKPIIEKQTCPDCGAIDSLEFVKDGQFYFCSECDTSFEKDEIDK